MADVGEIKKDIEELESLLTQASRQKVKDILQISIKKLQSDIVLREAANKTDATAQSIPQPIAKTTSTKSVITKDIKTYAWDQSDKFMKIYITLNGVQNIDKSNVTSEFSDSGFKLLVQGLDGGNHSCRVAYLFADIIPESSYHKVKTDMVLVMLRKREEKQTWAYVTKREIKEKDKKKPKMDNPADPNAGLMDMMKQMYDDGDDEMKRTLNKAWAESQAKKMSGDSDLSL